MGYPSRVAETFVGGVSVSQRPKPGIIARTACYFLYPAEASHPNRDICTFIVRMG